MPETYDNWERLVRIVLSTKGLKRTKRRGKRMAKIVQEQQDIHTKQEIIKPEENQIAEQQQQQDLHIRNKRKNKLTPEHRQKERELYREMLHKTRDTITLVAVLIATFTYTAGLNPPGGIYQDGPLKGTSIAARKTTFRVFSVCNNIALFISLCVVLILVSVIPFKRKAVMRIVTIAHKGIWLAVSFMATAYVAAAAVMMQPQPPHRSSMDWTTVFLLSICAGSLGTVFVGLGIMLIKHHVKKRKWRKQNPRERASKAAREKLMEMGVAAVEEDDDEDDETSSGNSDFYGSESSGYHTY